MEREGFKVTLLERSPIPIVKARGSLLEKMIVKVISWLELVLRREYQLLLIGQKQ